MKKYIIVINFFVLLGFAVLNHYLYDLCNNNMIVGLFCPINESVWEHLKLLFFPALIMLIVELFFMYYKKRFFISSVLSLAISLLSIIVLYYTITGIIGKNIDIINIGIMIVSIIIYLVLRKVFLRMFLDRLYYLSIFILITILIMFMIFTNKPLDIGLFK